jgi:hypothetical protein
VTLRFGGPSTPEEIQRERGRTLRVTYSKSKSKNRYLLRTAGVREAPTHLLGRQSELERVLHSSSRRSGQNFRLLWASLLLNVRST